MNYSTYRFTLDIHKTKSQVSIPVLFQDKGIQFFITLTDGGKPYQITEDTHVVLYGKKPQYHVDTGGYDTLVEDCEVIDDGTKIKYTFSDQTTTQLGSVACEFRLYKNGNLLFTTPAFEILVNERVIEDGEIIKSADDRSALDSLFAREQANAAAIENHEERIITVEGRSALNAYHLGVAELSSKKTTVPKEIEKAKEFATSEADSAKSAAIAGANGYTDGRIDELLDCAVLLNPETEEQTINSDIHILGRLIVDGEQTAVETKSLFVKDRFIVCNVMDGTNYSPEASGIAILTGKLGTDDYYGHVWYTAYGIVHDQATDTVRLGRGVLRSETVDGNYTDLINPTFWFGTAEFGADDYIVKEEEGQAISTRANTIQNGNIPKWDDTQKMFVDSGKSSDDFVEGAVLLDPTKEGQYEQEIKGSLSIEWDLIAGTLLSNGAFISCNNEGKHDLAGLVFPDGGLYTDAVEGDIRQDAYAIAFDKKTKTLRLGNGTIYRGMGSDFYFGWGLDIQELIRVDQAIATRADEIADGNIPKWDDIQKMFVDSGVSLGDIDAALDAIIALQNSLIGGNA